MKGLLATIRWHDAIDVALCAAIVYRVLAAFRGTRAVQMVLGLGVLVAGTVLARRLELHTLRWLLDNFWSFWVVALVVLFQPELRRALGTRHRAALGISEETDAVALTVSEETGRISIAIEGQLEPANDGGVVRSRLNDLLVGELVGASETSLVRGVRRWLPGTHDSAQNSG